MPCVCVYVRVYVRACGRAGVCACVRASERARVGIALFTLFHNPTELRKITVNQKGEKKSAVLKRDRTQDPSVMVQCATDYATAASSFDSLLLYLINVTNEISCI